MRRTRLLLRPHVITSGNYTWTSSDIYADTIPNMLGCDSVITVNLTINKVDTAISQTGVTLSADVSGMAYQWLDCINGNSILSGETNQSFTATVNGNYAVEITENSCVDTSSCYTITTVGIIENNFENILVIYPNPSNGDFTIDLGAMYEKTTITITDIYGGIIEKATYHQSQILHLTIEASMGVYFMTVSVEREQVVVKLVTKVE